MFELEFILEAVGCISLMVGALCIVLVIIEYESKDYRLFSRLQKAPDKCDFA